MKIYQIITDYIMKSILGTQGDMVVRGATQPEALAAVALGQVLKSGGVEAKPAWGTESELAGGNGCFYNLKMATTELVGLTGASVSWVGSLPTNSIAICVTARVTALITTDGAPHTWHLGWNMDEDAWGASNSELLDTVVDIGDYTITTPVYIGIPADIIVTSTVGLFTGGNVRLVVFYIELTPPTS